MGKKSILIVDDNVINLKLLRVLLAAEGYEVRTAAAAEQALTVLEELHPDLILMDIQLPGIDGLELTRQLKSDPTTKDIIPRTDRLCDERRRGTGAEGRVRRLYR